MGKTQQPWLRQIVLSALTMLLISLLSLMISSAETGGLVAAIDTSQTNSLLDEDRVQNPSVQIGDGSKHISDINILLPIQGCIDCRKVYKQISAINGCYKWQISAPTKIKLEPIPSKTHPACSNIVIVSNL